MHCPHTVSPSLRAAPCQLWVHRILSARATRTRKPEDLRTRNPRYVQPSNATQIRSCADLHLVCSQRPCQRIAGWLKLPVWADSFSCSGESSVFTTLLSLRRTAARLLPERKILLPDVGVFFPRSWMGRRTSDAPVATSPSCGVCTLSRDLTEGRCSRRMRPTRDREKTWEVMQPEAPSTDRDSSHACWLSPPSTRRKSILADAIHGAGWSFHSTLSLPRSCGLWPPQPELQRHFA